MFELVLWDDEGEGCTFYSCSEEIEGGDESILIEQFFQRFENILEFEEDVNFMATILGRIKDEGARIEWFRPEDEVQALPPKPHSLSQLGLDELAYHAQLRLYVMRLSDGVLILFDGEHKNTSANQDKGSKVHFKWRDALFKAKRIRLAFESGDLKIFSRRIEDTSGNSKRLVVY